ncbi:MAG: exonuclease subunit SbcD, partial [Kiritimatiellae bacterium]|nr:exonuclease subunit SbcD [Kiritimatiellia bacterium]
MKKLVHTADLHLGAKLHEKDRLDEQTRLLDWLCGVLARERPDALVLAGDLFDVYYPPSGVQRVWYDFLARVRGEGLAGSVVAVAGNHDSPSALGCSGRVLGLIGAHLLAGDTRADEEAFAVDCADGGRMGFAAIPFLREGLLRTEGGGDAARGFA